MSDNEKLEFCGNCGEKISGDKEFCNMCGNPLNQEKPPKFKETSSYNNNTINNMHCPYCQSEIPNNVSKCKYCGEWVNQSNFSMDFLNNKSTIIGIVVFIIFFIIQIIAGSTYYVNHATLNIAFWGFTFIMIMLTLIFMKIK
ncbi:double zinc ribbon domain-containing protein [Methanobrevibacter sp. DSM 116169]|uniref:double zinc ribbon domain-containing protein n=1 Tax=Methanobrevibacter sp. DSM 116169 TaxID=3242727 RepID=UPI0038FC1844